MKEGSVVQRLYIIPSALADGTKQHIATVELLEVLKRMPAFFVESKKLARRFISQLGLTVNYDAIGWYELTKDTSWRDVDQMFQEIQELGFSEVGVLSDAGCPGIADPGSLAVQYAHKNHIQVIPLVGASSIFLALMASGFNGQSFIFHGYIPVQESQRVSFIKSMEKDVIKHRRTHIFIETPYRNKALLDSILKTCHSHTKLCIASHITAGDEYIKTTTIEQWLKIPIDIAKKPTVFLLGI